MKVSAPFRIAFATLLLLTLLLLLLAPTPASARSFTTGFGDPLFYSDSVSVRDQWLSRAKAEGAGMVRILVPWSSIAPAKPKDPRDPSDPAYEFRVIDRGVTSALAHGLSPLLLINRAPAWAEGKGRDHGAPAGTWKPSPNALADFVAAVAKRYPAVRFIQLWNEPNLRGNMTPQHKGKRVVAAVHYRKMVNKAYAALHSVDTSDQLLTAGLAPYGDDKGPVRSRPLTFWRTLFCLNRRLKRSCKAKTNFDIFAMHAFNTGGPPSQSALDKDDMNPVDMSHARKIVRSAEKRGTAPGGHHPLWVTEIWWNSNPPQKGGYSLSEQARYLEETMYLAWKIGATVALNLRLRDSQFPHEIPASANGTYFFSGTPKPSATAFKFPFVTERGNKRNRSAVKVWGKSPRAGTVIIQRKQGADWKAIKRLKTRASNVFSGQVKLKGRPSLRAQIDGASSLPWKVR